MTAESLLRIGELSRKANVTPRTIRFYVQEGLLPQPERQHKKLALYRGDCIAKIQAVKKAQNERFLPLVVIRQILEQANWDYSILECIDLPAFGPISPVEAPSRRKVSEPDIPEDILRSLKRRKLIQTGKRLSAADEADNHNLKRLLLTLNSNGVPWHELLRSLDTIQHLAEEIAELEAKALLSGVMKNPTETYYELLRLEEKTMLNLITKVRQRSLRNIVLRYKSDLDYAFMASADEGYAVEPETIQPILKELAAKVSPSCRDIRLLNDLALGYSCLGNQKASFRFLQRIRKFAPDDPETTLRWIWYRRFAQRQQYQKRLKDQMENLVRMYPGFALGHAFMAVWHLFDIQGTDNPYEVFRLTNQCLSEMEAAEHHLPDDIHEWTLIHYIKGKVFGQLQLVPEYYSTGTRAIEAILERKEEIDQYYAREKQFFSHWLWPNIYLFLGQFYNQAGRFEEALRRVSQGRKFQMVPPYQQRVEIEIQTAQQGLAATS